MTEPTDQANGRLEGSDRANRSAGRDADGQTAPVASFGPDGSDAFSGPDGSVAPDGASGQAGSAAPDGSSVPDGSSGAGRRPPYRPVAGPGWALITGGAVGIGRAFAWELARRGFDLVLASRDADALAAVAAELHQRYGRQVEVLPTDLADRRDTLALAARLEDQTRPIDLLVNNAGFGLHASLVDLDLELHARAIEVMAVAPLILQAAAARAMRARGHGAIVNVTSSSAVLTAGDYSAIKSFATINTESLAVELAGSGVAVMAVLPGWVQTEFHRRAGLKANNFPSWLGRAVWIPAAKLAAEALYDLGRGKVLSVPTGRWNFAVWLARVVPRRAIRAVSGALTKSRT